jgi:excisionase family DNA binding protein
MIQELSQTVTPLMSIRQVAFMLNLSRRTVYRLVENGRLKAYRPNRRMMRFRLSDVEALINQSGELEVDQLSEYITKNIT